MSQRTNVSQATAEEERAEADRAHVSGPAPSADEDEAADRGRENTEADSDAVAEHYAEMTEIGAHVKGEGSLE